MSVKGKGHTFSVADPGESPTYAALAKVRDINGPGITVASLDATHALSEAIEKTAGFLDGGDITVSLLFNDEDAEDIAALLELTKLFRINLSNGAKWDATGFITSLGTISPYQDMVTQDITVAVSGKPTFTKAPTP